MATLPWIFFQQARQIMATVGRWREMGGEDDVLPSAGV